MSYTFREEFLSYNVCRCYFFYYRTNKMAVLSECCYRSVSAGWVQFSPMWSDDTRIKLPRLREPIGRLKRREPYFIRGQIILLSGQANILQ